jgi:Flp pilus assembly protein CpaB
VFGSLRLPRLGKWPRLLIAAGCLVLALGSALGAKHDAARSPRSAAVVVAARELPAGHLLARRDVAVARWPPAIRPTGARADPGSVIGQRLAGPVRAREALTTTRLVGADLAAELPGGLVAASVSLADPHAIDLVRAGDHVDLLETAAPPEIADPGRIGAARVRSVATHVVALAVLPGSAETGPELVLAVDRMTAVRITRDSSSHVFTAVVAPP